MPIRVSCSECGASFNAPDGSEGKRGKCPKCDAVITVRKPVERTRPKPPLRPSKIAAERAAKKAVKGKPPEPADAWPPSNDLAASQPVVASVPPAMAPEPATPRAELDHTHRAKRSFFTGFKGAMGCFAALGVVTMLGCLGVVAMMVTGVAVTGVALEEGVKQVRQRANAYNASIAAVTDRIDFANVTASGSSGPYDAAKLVLNFQVRNGSEHPVSQVTAAVTIREPGRSIAFAEGNIAIDFPGGIEPGEQLQKEFRVNPFMDPGKNAPPPGALVEMSAVDADWPGKPSRF